MNFEMAAEMAALEGIRTETVKVSDDVASAPEKNIFREGGSPESVLYIRLLERAPKAEPAWRK